MQLIADIRHRRLVHHPTVHGINDGQEVRPLDARALVQAGQIEELLWWRLDGLGRGRVKRLRLVCHGNLLSVRAFGADDRAAALRICVVALTQR
jgi:hypothetical protein